MASKGPIILRMPALIKPAKVIGKSAVLRNATEQDAEFILTLRRDPAKGRFLSATAADLSLQIAWLEKYACDARQVYFIIETTDGRPMGTVRLYDVQGDSFCWGSWILKADAPQAFAIESTLMVYRFALQLGFSRSHFDVRKGNESVWAFHERFGATRVSETADDYLYTIGTQEIEAALSRYRRYLPEGIQIIA